MIPHKGISAAGGTVGTVRSFGLAKSSDEVVVCSSDETLKVLKFTVYVLLLCLTYTLFFQ